MSLHRRIGQLESSPQRCRPIEELLNIDPRDMTTQELKAVLRFGEELGIRPKTAEIVRCALKREGDDNAEELTVEELEETIDRACREVGIVNRPRVGRPPIEAYNLIMAMAKEKLRGKQPTDANQTLGHGEGQNQR